MKIKDRFLNWLKTIVLKVFPDSVTIDFDNMDDAIESWMSLYYDEPKWQKDVHYNTLNLPAGIAAEFARLIMIENEITITGSKRADYIARQFKRLHKKLQVNIEEACAVGGILFKPYVSRGIIYTDCLTQERFRPIQFTDDEITGIACFSRISRGKYYYCRVEKQIYDEAARTHTVSSRFYISRDPQSIGEEISADRYPLPITGDYVINNVDRPLFAFWRVPRANTVDKESPLGVSVYHPAIKKLHAADRQWDMFLWEYEGGELAVDIDDRFLRPIQKEDGTIVSTIPKGKERLFRRLKVNGAQDNPLYKVFAPQLRASEYGKGLDKILKQIEFSVGLSYGTISDPQNVDKTAEEVKSSKYRSYGYVSRMQASLQDTLEDYIYALDQYAGACNLAPAGTYEVQWNWGDGVLEDTEKETQVRLQEVNSGITDPIDYLMWRYGYTEEQAREKLPKKGEFEDYFAGGVM